MPAATDRAISTAELAAHNTATSAWVGLRGHVYDVTDFVRRHPGGRDVLLFAAGRDATAVFETYHHPKAARALAKHRIGTLADNELPVFPEPSPFFLALKDRVYAELARRKQDPKGAPAMWARYAVIYAMIALAWYAQWVAPTPLAAVGWALILGFFCAQLGLHPLHDASHAAVTRSQTVWRILGATHDFLNGSSFVVWSYQHLLGHHPYTNIAHADPDISTADHLQPDIRRIKPSQRWFGHYIYQHVYVPILYGLLAIKTRIQDIDIMYRLKTNDRIRTNPMTPLQTAVFWGGKAFFVFYRVLVPHYVFGASWAKVAGLFTIADLVSSYWLALTFQANHVVEEVEWPTPDPATNRMSCCWAAMQVATTQDYAHKSFFWTTATGALNYQAVHHLFPQIHQIHYPIIAPVIMKTCKEFNVPYLVKDTFTEALGSHVGWMKNLGHRRDSAADLKASKKAQ